jgi:hypothetical protein
MYFLRLRPLKRDLAAQAISERGALPYLLWLGGLTALATILPYGDVNSWDYGGAVASVGIFLAGTVLAYRGNGGAAGQDFLIRYLCLNWVVGLRLLLLVGIPVFTAGVLLEELLFGEIPEETTAVGAFAIAVFEAVVYWRIVVHIRAVAINARAA